MLEPIHRLRLFALLIIAAVAPIPRETLAQPGFGGGANNTVAVVALSGWQPVLDDIGYLGGLVGQPQQAQAIEGIIGMFTGGQGLQGLDKTKPWGVIVQAGGGGLPTPVICLPINDLPAILQLGQGFGLKSEDAGGGVSKLAIPRSPSPVFVKQVGAWVYAAQTPELLDAQPANPESLFADLVADYDLGIRAFVQNVPAILREQAIDALQQGASQAMQPQDGESEDQFQRRKQMAESNVAEMRRAIEQLDELTVGVAINGGQPGVVLDISATGIDGSELAAELKAASAATTTLAGFDQPDATLRMMIHAQTPEEQLAKQAEQATAAIEPIRRQFDEAIENEQFPNEEARQVVKEVVSDMLDVYLETIVAGNFDASMALDLGPAGMQMLGGALVKSPEKVEEALKKLAGLTADTQGAPQPVWGTQSHAGVTFHTLTVPVPPVLPVVEDLLGSQLEFAVGIGSERVYLAAGPSWFERVSSAIDQSAAAGATPAKPMELSIALTDIAKIAGQVPGESQAPAQMLADALAQSSGDDKLTLSVEPLNDGVMMRFMVEEGVIRAAASVGQSLSPMGGGAPGPGFGPGF
ncbi:MAG: hypothetical protein AAGJ46_07005 [Planctomycetota bacterium]